MRNCLTCTYHKQLGSLCTRSMSIIDGSEIKVPRATWHERDDKSVLWKKIKRTSNDVCGKQARHWSEK